MYLDAEPARPDTREPGGESSPPDRAPFCIRLLLPGWQSRVELPAAHEWREGPHLLVGPARPSPTITFATIPATGSSVQARQAPEHGWSMDRCRDVRGRIVGRRRPLPPAHPDRSGPSDAWRKSTMSSRAGEQFQAVPQIFQPGNMIVERRWANAQLIGQGGKADARSSPPPHPPYPAAVSTTNCRLIRLRIGMDLCLRFVYGFVHLRNRIVQHLSMSNRQP